VIIKEREEYKYLKGTETENQLKIRVDAQAA